MQVISDIQRFTTRAGDLLKEAELDRKVYILVSLSN